MSRLAGLAVLLGPFLDDTTEAVLRRLVSEGARVALAAPDTSRRSDLVDSTGPNVVAVDVSAADVTSWRNAVDGAVAAFGGLHAVIECQMSTAGDDAASGDDPDNNTASGLPFAAEVALPHLAAAGGGAIIGVHRPSQASVLIDEAEAVSDLGARGIRCLAVRADPGSVETTLSDGGRPRQVTPGDVAAMVAFLLSDDAATCSGARFDVSAGAAWTGR